MKKILSLLMILMLASSTAMAAEKKSSKSKDKKSTKKEEKKQSSSNGGSEKGFWVIQAQGGVDFLGTNTGAAGATFTGTGLGAELTVAYSFNKNFSLGLLTGFHSMDLSNPADFGYTGGSWVYAPIEAVAQYSFDGSVKPFVFLGMGIAHSYFAGTDTTSSTISGGFSETEFIVTPGIGMSFEVSEKINFFVQTKIDILSASPSWKSSLWADGVFIPIQVGVNFSAL